MATLLENYDGLLRKMDRDSEAEKMEARAQAIRAKYAQQRRGSPSCLRLAVWGVASGNCTVWPSRKWVLVQLLCSFCEIFYIHLETAEPASDLTYCLTGN